MNEACKLLRSSLKLYAEGELCRSTEIRRLRRHLDGCTACRAFLASYDALTRRVIADGIAVEEPWGSVAGEIARDEIYGGTAEDGGRLHFSSLSERRRRRLHALAGIERLPHPRPRSGGFSRWIPGFSQTAAAVLLTALMLHLVVLSSSTYDERITETRFRPGALDVARKGWTQETRRSPSLGEMRFVFADDLQWYDTPPRGRPGKARSSLLLGQMRQSHGSRHEVGLLGSAVEEEFSLVLKVRVGGVGLEGSPGRVLLVPEEWFVPELSDEDAELLLAHPVPRDARAVSRDPRARAAWRRMLEPTALVSALTWVDLVEMAEVRSLAAAASRGYRLVAVRTTPPRVHRTVPQVSRQPFWRSNPGPSLDSPAWISSEFLSSEPLLRR